MLKKHLITLTVLSILLFLIVPVAHASTSKFSDLPPDDPSQPFVKYLLEQGIIKGYPDGSFHPNEPVTRAEVAALLVRAAAIKDETTQVKPFFNDVPQSHWAFQAIEAVNRAGLMKGYPDQSFRPEEYLDRAQAAALLLRLTKVPMPQVVLPELEDLDQDYWAAKDIAAALDAGLITLAAAKKYEPEQPASRTILARGLALMLALRPESGGEPLVGMLVPQKGQVTLQKPGSEAVEINSPIEVTDGSSIITGVQGVAEVRFPDGSGLLLQPGTDIYIREARGRKTILRDGSAGTVVNYLKLHLSRGRMFGALAGTHLYRYDKTQTQTAEERTLLLASTELGLGGELPAQEENPVWWQQPFEDSVRVEVDMPWGVAGVRGTFWMNEVSAGREITNVVDGSVQVSSGGKSKSVQPGYSAKVTSPKKSLEPETMTDKEKASWLEVKDWVSERALTIQDNAPVVAPALEQQGQYGLWEIFLPPVPPVVDEVMKSFMEAVSSNRSNSGGGSSRIPPKVSNTEPADGASGVPVNQKIRVTFNQEIWTGSKFSEILLESNGVKVSTACEINYNILDFILSSDLTAATTYTVYIPKEAVKSLSGEELHEDYTFSFSTAVNVWDQESLPIKYCSGYVAYAVDDAGNTHIFYKDILTQSVNYAYKDTTGWQIEAVDSESDYPFVALDEMGKPHVCYRDSLHNLKYAYRNATGWQIETVDNSSCVDGYTSLALDKYGNPHISYHYVNLNDGDYRNTGNLRYAYKGVSGWQIETVDKFGDFTSITLDSAGNPHISYRCGGDLKYAYKVASMWHLETVDNGGDSTSIVLDSAGNPHISHVDWEFKTILKYACRGAEGWLIEPIDSYGEFDREVSIALNSTERPYVSYRDNSSNYLKYAYKGVSGWQIETLDKAYGNYGIKINKQGSIHVIYTDTSGNLIHAYLGKEAPGNLDIVNTSPDDNAVNVSSCSQITVEFNKRILPGPNFSDIKLLMGETIVSAKCNINSEILEIDPENCMETGKSYTVIIPAGAVSDERGAILANEYMFSFTTGSDLEWYSENVGSSEIYPTVSLSLDAADKPYIIYNDEIGAKYAYREELCWQLEEVNVVSYDDNISFDMDMFGDPHMCYHNYDSDDLNYAFGDSSGWKVNTVDNNGRLPSIVVDAVGLPHICYFDSNNEDLKYAYQDEGIWHIEIVESDGQVGYFPSLALDTANKPSIVYYDETNGKLKYAHRETLGWEIETVDDGYVGFGEDTSLALDKTGNPYICYFDQTSKLLKYAYKNANMGWTAETIDTDEFFGGYTSTAIDGSGNSHICYYFSGGNLKYAFKGVSGWRIETIVDDVAINGTISMDLDVAGYPHISYYDDTNKKVKYVYKDKVESNPPVVVSTVPPDGAVNINLDQEITIVFDKNIWPGNSFGKIKFEGSEVGVSCSTYGVNLIIKPTNKFSPGLTCKLYIPAGAVEDSIGNELADNFWLSFATKKTNMIEVVDSDGDVGEYAAMSLDNVGDPHISYLGGFNQNLMYAYRGDSGWISEQVITCDEVLQDNSIDVDESGNPHICYCDFYYDGFRINYAYKGNRTWQFETVDGIGSEPSIKLDDSGAPHISYCGWFGTNLLKYAYRGPSGWQIEIVDSDGNVGSNNSIALDAFGSPHISYLGGDADKSVLKYAYKGFSGWLVDTVDSDGTVGYFSSIAVDMSGNPHISYYDWDNRILKYAYKGQFGWKIEVVDSEGEVGLYTSIALDAAGSPHISYYDLGNLSLKHAYRNSAGFWQVETIDSGNDVGMYTSIALDPIGNTHISYFDDTNKDLKYVKIDNLAPYVNSTYPETGEKGVSIDTEITVNLNEEIIAGSTFSEITLSQDENEIATNSSISGNTLIIKPSTPLLALTTYEVVIPEKAVLDNAGNHLVTDVKFSFTTGNAWQIEIVDSTGNVGQYNALAMDDLGKAHISYYDITTNNLKHACKETKGWQVETVSQTPYCGYYSTLAVDEEHALHISFLDYACQDLKYACKDTSGWHIDTVDSKGDVGYYTSLALDALGMPCISYYDATSRNLKYAWKDNAGWQKETVDDAVYSGAYTSLAFDKLGQPSISYYDSENQNLKFACKLSNGWDIAEVDLEGDVGYYTALTFDADGSPHISYYDAANNRLKHAWKNAGEWQTEIVDEKAYSGYFTSIEADMQGRLHISYYNNASQDLKYASKDNSGWHVETVDYKGYVGSYTSLIIDEYGNPCISYYDSTNQDLKFARLVPTNH